MKVLEFDFEIDITGLVKVTPDGDVLLLSCPLTHEIERRTRLTFDSFCISYGFYHQRDSIVCSYSVFGDEEPYVYHIEFSSDEYEYLDRLWNAAYTPI